MQAWAQQRRITLELIQPGNPQQNAYIERYNRTVRYDWLAHDLFDTIEQVQHCATHWLWFYKHQRPNMGIGGITRQRNYFQMLCVMYLLAKKFNRPDMEAVLRSHGAV